MRGIHKTNGRNPARRVESECQTDPCMPCPVSQVLKPSGAMTIPGPRGARTSSYGHHHGSVGTRLLLDRPASGMAAHARLPLPRGSPPARRSSPGPFPFPQKASVPQRRQHKGPRPALAHASPRQRGPGDRGRARQPGRPAGATPCHAPAARGGVCSSRSLIHRSICPSQDGGRGVA